MRVEAVVAKMISSLCNRKPKMLNYFLSECFISVMFCVANGMDNGRTLALLSNFKSDAQALLFVLDVPCFQELSIINIGEINDTNALIRIGFIRVEIHCILIS